MKVRMGSKMNKDHVYFVGLDLNLPQRCSDDASNSQHLLSVLGETG